MPAIGSGHFSCAATIFNIISAFRISGIKSLFDHELNVLIPFVDRTSAKKVRHWAYFNSDLPSKIGIHIDASSIDDIDIIEQNDDQQSNHSSDVIDNGITNATLPTNEVQSNQFTGFEPPVYQMASLNFAAIQFSVFLPPSNQMASLNFAANQFSGFLPPSNQFSSLNVAGNQIQNVNNTYNQYSNFGNSINQMQGNEKPANQCSNFGN